MSSKDEQMDNNSNDLQYIQVFKKKGGDCIKPKTKFCIQVYQQNMDCWSVLFLLGDFTSKNQYQYLKLIHTHANFPGCEHSQSHTHEHCFVRVGMYTASKKHLISVIYKTFSDKDFLLFIKLPWIWLLGLDSKYTNKSIFIICFCQRV